MDASDLSTFKIRSPRILSRRSIDAPAESLAGIDAEDTLRPTRAAEPLPASELRADAS